MSLADEAGRLRFYTLRRLADSLQCTRRPPDCSVAAAPQFTESFFLTFQNLVQLVDKLHQLLGILLLAGSLRDFSPVEVVGSSHSHRHPPCGSTREQLTRWRNAFHVPSMK